MAVNDNTGYIIVNNSGTVEAVDITSLESLGSLSGLSSPRQIMIHSGKAYISSLSSNSITVLDLVNFSVSDNIDIGCSSEALAIAGNRLFASNWAGGNRIIVVDLTDNSVETSITTGMEPESMVIDKNDKLWVLCTGGYLNEETPKIMVINTSNLEVEKELPFRTNTDNPSSLTINSGRDTIYFIDEGVRRMTTDASALPTEVLIQPEGRLLYKLAIAPWNGLICVTDAIDYQQKGDLLIFDKAGNLLDKEETGIIPGFICFTE